MRAFIFLVAGVSCACVAEPRFAARPLVEPSGVDAGSDAGEEASPRGEYLVRHVLACGECHTPRFEDGSLDESRFLSGADCSDMPAARSGGPCTPAPNLTPHATGIARYDRQQLERMIFEGVRPDGRVLNATAMPYYVYRAATREDAAAIIAYLRSLPPIDHAVEAVQARSWQRATAVLPIDLPEAASTHAPDVAAGIEHGRYLVTLACVACHTPFNRDSAATQPLDLRQALAGGRGFSHYVRNMLSPNLTPDATGLGAWSRDEIVRAVREGVGPDGRALCAPMPRAFSGLSPEDAADIAAYLQAIPAVANRLPLGCRTGN